MRRAPARMHACRRPPAADRSTPAANGRRETEVPIPPNCPTALASTSRAISGDSQASAQGPARPLSPASAKPFSSLIFSGRSSTSMAIGGRGIEHRGEGRGDPAGARQGARGVADFAAHQARHLQPGHARRRWWTRSSPCPSSSCGSNVDGRWPSRAACQTSAASSHQQRAQQPGRACRRYSPSTCRSSCRSGWCRAPPRWPPATPPAGNTRFSARWAYDGPSA